MNWIDSHNRVDEGITVGSYRINRLFFADDLVLLGSSNPGVGNLRSAGRTRLAKQNHPARSPFAKS